MDKRLGVEGEPLARIVGSEMFAIVLSNAAAARARKPPGFWFLFEKGREPDEEVYWWRLYPKRVVDSAGLGGDGGLPTLLGRLSAVVASSSCSKC